MTISYDPKRLLPVFLVFLGGGAQAASDSASTLREYAVEADRTRASTPAVALADSSALGLPGAARLQDVPRSVAVVDAEFVRNQQAQYVSDVLRTNPTVTHTSGTNTVGGGASFSLRGFASGTTELIDGLPANSRVPVEDKEKIELLNGPASFLYGIASPGGTINYVQKRPTAAPLLDLTVGDYGGSQAYVLGDAGGTVAGGTVGLRFTGLYVNDGETGIAGQTHERDLASGALDWHLLPGVTW